MTIVTKPPVPEAKQLALSTDVLVIITDPAHALYDERINLPVNEALVASIQNHGVMEPVLVRRNGTKYEVINGRQRIKAVIEANKRGKGVKIRVPVIIRQDEDTEAAGVMIATNELRTADTPVVKARKARRALALGASLEELTLAFGISTGALKNLMSILDCDKAVQVMFDKGLVPVSGASRIARLPREDQAKAMEDLQASGGATKERVRAKVKAITTAKKTGKPEVPVPEKGTGTVPTKQLIKQAIDVYPEKPTGLDELVNPHLLLLWTLTGTGAENIVPGPDGYGSLGDWIKSLNRGTGRHTKARA